jgi:hypothetical protein
MHALDRPAPYRITVAGRLGSRWGDWFPGLTITHESDADGAMITALSGLISDQAALRGTLGQIWNLGLVLLSVTRMDALPSSGGSRIDADKGDEP